MTRGEIYRTRDRVPERGDKPGFYFIAGHESVATVICAPVYSEVLGLTTEVLLATSEGLPHTCAVRCDFLMLMFKRKLTQFVATLPAVKIRELNRALAAALDIRSLGR